MLCVEKENIRDKLLTDITKNAVATNTEDAMIVTPAMGPLVICENIFATLKIFFAFNIKDVYVKVATLDG